MKRTLFLFALIASTAFSSCKKDKADSLEDAAIQLQGKNWRLVSLSIQPAYYGVTDALAYWERCDLDNLYLFQPQNVFVLDAGAEKCYPDEDQQTPGFWSYSNTTKQLSFSTTNGDSYSIKLTHISETAFVGKETVVEDGVTYTGTWVFEL